MVKVIKLEYVNEKWEPETLYVPEEKGEWQWEERGYYTGISDEFLIHRMQHYTFISKIRKKNLEIVLFVKDQVEKIHKWGSGGFFCPILLNEKEGKFFTNQAYPSNYNYRVISNLKRCYITTREGVVSILKNYENTNIADWKYVPSALFDDYTTKILKHMWKTIKQEVRII